MKTSPTLKGHGVEYYKNRNKMLLNSMVHLLNSEKKYSKDFIKRQHKRIKIEYEANNVVIEAYNILNNA